jgi:lipid-binding SYLF domain-containing protein
MSSKQGLSLAPKAGGAFFFAKGERAGRYRTTAASYGLRAGAQKFGYALFFMNQKAIDWVIAARGWSIGSAPSLVVLDKGRLARLTPRRSIAASTHSLSISKALWPGSASKAQRSKDSTEGKHPREFNIKTTSLTRN